MQHEPRPYLQSDKTDSKIGDSSNEISTKPKKFTVHHKDKMAGLTDEEREGQRQLIDKEEKRDSKLTPQQRENQDAFRKKVAKRYDELLQERADLQTKLEQYDSSLNQGLFLEGMLSDSEVKLIVAKWLRAVREQTEFLKPLDELGIKIFTDNLADQPGFPNIKIVFSSTELTEKNNNTEGLASINEINLTLQKPSLRHQLFDFLTTGKLNYETDALIHELIHQYHGPEAWYEPEPTEAQAYWSGILSGDFSFVNTLKKLVEPRMKGGLYQFDMETISRILMGIATLNGLGKSEKEIADLVRITRHDYETNKFSPLEDELDKIMEANGLDEIDTQTAHDIYRLHTTNQRLKARLLLNKVIQSTGA